MLKRIEILGFKSFSQKSVLDFDSPVCAVVGPNGSGKSNVVEALRFALGEQSMKSLRGKKGEDLIFNGSQYTPRSNVARVKVVFENSDRKIDLDFNDVEIERVVYRDGVNQYFINKSQARLKDVSEILAGANIGSSSYHIISQGEADKFLRATNEERRVMLEEALGLSSYKFKKRESEKKLKRTYENISQIESKRRELAPSLRFLKKETEKAKRAREAREKLGELYLKYLKIESEYISYWKKWIEKEVANLEEQIFNIKNKIENITEEAGFFEESLKEKKIKQKIEENKKRLSEILNSKNELIREMGKIEGKMSSLTDNSLDNKETKDFKINFKEVSFFADDILSKASFEEENDVENLKNRLNEIKEKILELKKIGENKEQRKEDDKDLKKQKEMLNENFEDLTKKLEKIEVDEKEIKKINQEEREALENESRGKIKQKEEVFELESKIKDLGYNKERIWEFKNKIEREEMEFKKELSDAAFITGRGVLSYESCKIFSNEGKILNSSELANEPRENQKERKNEIEKYKFRLEESGVNTNIEKIEREYIETLNQDEFLAKELSDLTMSAKKLGILINDLDNKIGAHFNSGIEKINLEFKNFFSLLFGGGDACLKLTYSNKKFNNEDFIDEDIEEKQKDGVDIKVSLPGKKIKGLEMLSGGERTLTSAALMFAVSQVNPPPFLILDEVDAALDEVNSRRFGEMVSELSKKSQLILVSHNRETMGTAGVLYGVTMSGDGVSKLLSVKFDEAVEMTGN